MFEELGKSEPWTQSSQKNNNNRTENTETVCQTGNTFDNQRLTSTNDELMVVQPVRENVCV